MKVLFLDIDGVLNSYIEAEKWGGLFITTKDVSNKLQPLGCEFMRWLSERDVKIVLSSTWRFGLTRKEADKVFPFPLHSCTEQVLRPEKTRGEEISEWLFKNPSVTHCAILDDDTDFPPEQIPHLARVDEMIGVSSDDILKVKMVLEIE